VVDFDYDALGRRTRLTLPNGVVTEASYDAASRLAELIYRSATGMLLGNLTYQYDATGHHTQVGGSFARTLLPAPVASATYDPANRQVTFETAQLTYDANGNLTSDGTKSYHWDARNRLVELSGPGLTASFQYDALARRSTRVVNGVSSAFLYDGVNPVQELSGTSATANMLSGLRADEYYTRTDTRGILTLLTDALGSILALTDSAGTMPSAYTYEPYGMNTITGATNSNSFRYTGREDDGTGLYYYRTRYYSPSIGRFISEDSIGFAGGNTNLYTYVLNDPVNWTDPLGLVRWDDAGSAFAGLVGNSLGVLGGAALGGTGVGTVAGAVIATKSLYGVLASAVNLVAALQDVDQLTSGSLFNDIATLAAPCDKNAQAFASVADLALDLVGGRIAKMPPSSLADPSSAFSLEAVSRGDLLTGNLPFLLDSLSGISALKTFYDFAR
jgi:RHS repeat-associated protein